jgi:ribosomal protection tetracycline resistance protein
VLLYGEVQKEVIAERLIREFGVEPDFSTTSPIYIERPIGIGEAEYVIDPLRGNDFWATIGVRLVPTEIGQGNKYVREVPWGQMPPAFYRAIEESAMETLEQGLLGWRVTDCSVHLVKLGYDRPITVAADFRCLTPILVMRALEMAGTRIFEPCQSFELEVPDDSLGDVISFLSTHDAKIGKTEQAGATTWIIYGEIPVRLVQGVAIALPGLTHGEAMLMLLSGSDRPVRGEAPVRPRTDGNPRDYEEYMRYLTVSGLMR